VEVLIREIKTDVMDKRGKPTTKITLSLKALSSDPWDAIDMLAPVGKVLAGSVVRVADFGAFVRIAAGIDGLLHVSELGGNVQSAAAALKVGTQMNVVVRSVDKANKKISLVPAADGVTVGSEAKGLSISTGAIVRGIVDRQEPYGIFVQLEGSRGRAGRGLIPNIELGTPRGADTRKLFPLGMELTVKVLETGEGKLRLSIRAIKDDEERADFDGYRETVKAAGGMGTFGDLLKKLK
jgi:small subunit ribosomal protein S1